MDETTWNDNTEQIDVLIEDLINIKEREVAKQFFSNEITTLKNHAQEHGLSEDNLKKMVDFLIPSKLNESQYKLVLHSLIPVNTISSDLVEKFVIWLISFQNYKTNQNKASWILQWINGLLDFNLLDPKIVGDYYQMLIPMLKIVKLAPRVANIIYRSTKYTHVNKNLIEKLRALNQTIPMPCYKVILRKYKEFRPDLIPENIPHQNLNTCFSSIPTELKDSFERAQERLNSVVDGSSIATGTNKDFMMIPKYTTIDFIASIYQKKSKSIPQFDDINSLMQNIHDIKEPSQALSCLNDQRGFMYLISSDKQFQRRFSYTLYNMLYKVFILEEGNVSVKEKKQLLTQIAHFQMILPIGHSSVSYFLKQFFLLWDFEDVTSEILNLVQYIVFQDFQDLYDSFLYHIYRLFLVSEVPVKNEIIKCLADFIERIITFGLIKNKYEGENDVLSKSFKFNWEFGSTFANIIKYVDKICEQALNIENSDFMILHNSVQLYEKVNMLEMKYELPTFTITPPGVAYRCMFSSDVLFVSRISKLFERYISIFEKSQNLDESIHPTINKSTTLVNVYINDFVAFVLKGQAFENEISYFKGSKLEDMCSDFQFPFDLTQHIAFMPTILTILKKLPHQEIIRREDIINELDPSIQSLFKKLNQN